MYCRITDLDRDSLQELVASVCDPPGAFSYSVRVYENVGDDDYLLRARLGPTHGVPLGLAQTDDLDGDGWPELVNGTDANRVVFYEAVGNDTFVEAALLSLYPHSFVDAVAAAPDLDHDGRPEALVLGVSYYDTAMLAVFESPCDDSFEVVWSEHLEGSYYGEHELALGDVDGDGELEIAASDGYRIRLFRCTGDDAYEEFWQTANYKKEVGLHDINSDGKDELIYRSGNETIILEYTEVGVAEHEMRRLQGVQVVPSVVRRGVAVRTDGLEGRCSVQVLDAAGRVVAEPEDGVWRTDGVSPGVYFFRFGPSAASCRPSAVSARKVLVVE